MRQALRSPTLRQPVGARLTARVETFPPPIGGWNDRDTLPLMEPTDAIVLENWIPDTNSVRQRGGFTTHATALSGNFVETLVEYRSPSASKLFAATPTIIYEVTSAGAGTSVVTSMSNGRWQDATMVNTAGTFLILVNGQDAPRTYDGTTHGTASISASGLTNTNLIGVKNHMNRLWFIEENQLHVWYLGTSAIAGTLTKFLPPFRKGGKLLAMASWTRDGGAGPDDYAAFISSKGECIIYAGTDPVSADTFALVGVFEIPDVIGRRCIIKAGTDLGILTMQGLVPLASVLGMSEGAAGRTSFTNKITGYFRRQFFTTGASFGWQPVEYPRGNLLIINVPVAERVTQHQAVLNINTGAWCKFTGLNAGCWATRNNDIYFGGNDGKVYKFDSATLDGTSRIVSVLQHAYGSFGSPQTKRFTMARPLFLSPIGYSPPVAVQTDYAQIPPTVSVVAASLGGTQWDAAQWDTFQWAGGVEPSLGWQSVAGVGRAGSIVFAVSSGETLVYNGTDVMVERGHWL